ncbi:MAG: hypothetical protein ACLQJR_03100 [Stellaceae bacterium]
MAALHKYYLRAETMRAHYDKTVEILKSVYGPTEWMKDKPNTVHFEARLYLDYWLAALYVVVEGFEKLSLHNAATEKLLKSPLRSKLNQHRGGTYHFREQYFDADILALVTAEGGAQWAAALHGALGTHLLATLKARQEKIEAQRLKKAERG